ncbi:MAG TPA: PQQ-dependent sugar dehydrogenase [Terriglobales bacterium]|nr:PQQ-dependent sugar dehydrogenase [Terriglobales bacterium]
MSLILLISGCGGNGSLTTTPPPPAGTPSIAVSPFVGGFSNPVDFQTPDDGSGRIFIVQQTGTIRILSGGALLPAPFLDISARVNFDSAEQGLLGLAFHPSYSQNRRFYLNYDRLSGSQMQTVIAEYQLTADPNVADIASERILLTVDQPFANHKGGQMAFGPDGFLYIAFGDGGNGGDPLGNGQNRQTLLGKIARIDVDHTDAGLQYAIPADNPFVGSGDRGEIWAYGFRNPWRFSFETGTGRLFVADVGQDKYEEVDLVQKGLNYGWNIMEGLHCFNPSTNCSMTGLTLPIAEYDHSEGDTVIGGYVYHGTAIQGLSGAYVFGDFSNGKIWELTESSGTWTRTLLLNSGHNMSAFGQDSAGELYLVDYSGSVLKIVAK